MLLFLVFPVLGIIGALAVVAGGSHSPGSTAPPLVDREAPDFTLQTTEGQPVRFGTLRGKWVFLNFWAIWCAPCRQEMRTFQRVLNGDFGPVSDRLAILAVYRAEDADTVQGFLQALVLPLV